MPFILRPILSEIKELYTSPISRSRFDIYLNKLQGNQKDNLKLPIMGFNPMAKNHIIQKIEELEKLEAEILMEEQIHLYNANMLFTKLPDIYVVLNLADDLGGAWSNHYTTDFDSKFKIKALVNRNFCTPYFWTSETYSRELIISRTIGSMARTLYMSNQKKPRKLEDYINQEIYVCQQYPAKNKIPEKKFLQASEAFYLRHKHSNNYNLIFNFFYGDLASQSLGYQLLRQLARSRF